MCILYTKYLIFRITLVCSNRYIYYYIFMRHAFEDVTPMIFCSTVVKIYSRKILINITHLKIKNCIYRYNIYYKINRKYIENIRTYQLSIIIIEKVTVVLKNL